MQERLAAKVRGTHFSLKNCVNKSSKLIYVSDIPNQQRDEKAPDLHRYITVGITVYPLPVL